LFRKISSYFHYKMTNFGMILQYWLQLGPECFGRYIPNINNSKTLKHIIRIFFQNEG